MDLSRRAVLKLAAFASLRVPSTVEPATTAPEAVPAQPESAGGGTAWVSYRGRRTAPFAMQGLATGHWYMVHGQGDTLEVDGADIVIFERAGQGQDFVIWGGSHAPL